MIKCAPALQNWHRCSVFSFWSCLLVLWSGQCLWKPSIPSAKAKTARILRQKRALLRHCNAWQSWKAFYGSVSIDANIASKPATWVFLGPPGVGKGTYSTRIAEIFGFHHIAAGDLVRAEIKKGTSLGKEMAEITNTGKLLPYSMILRVIRERYSSAVEDGVDKFLLDGFPRTIPQAEALEEFADVQLALNLNLREEVLVEKCLGRRICSKCGKNYNVANIFLEASEDRPAIVMPPLDPPKECLPYLEQRADDKEETIRHRLQVYKTEAKPVEDFYRSRGALLDFEITGGIPETLPSLKNLLGPYNETKNIGNKEQAMAG